MRHMLPWDESRPGFANGQPSSAVIGWGHFSSPAANYPRYLDQRFQ